MKWLNPGNNVYWWYCQICQRIKNATESRNKQFVFLKFLCFLWSQIQASQHVIPVRQSTLWPHRPIWSASDHSTKVNFPLYSGLSPSATPISTSSLSNCSSLLLSFKAQLTHTRKTFIQQFKVPTPKKILNSSQTTLNIRGGKNPHL